MMLSCGRGGVLANIITGKMASCNCHTLTKYAGTECDGDKFSLSVVTYHSLWLLSYPEMDCVVAQSYTLNHALLQLKFILLGYY